MNLLSDADAESIKETIAINFLLSSSSTAIVFTYTSILKNQLLI